MASKRKKAAQKALAALKEQWAIFKYKPSAKQQAYHDSNAYFRFLSAGGRGGKTTSMLAEAVMMLLGVHPTKPWYGPVTIAIGCLSRQQATLSVQHKLFESADLKIHDEHGNIIGECREPLIPESEILEYEDVKQGFRFYYGVRLRNGSRLVFFWAGDEHSWEKIQGVELDAAFIDENAGNEKLVIELWKRLLDVQSMPSKKPWGGSFTWGATGTIVNEVFERFRESCMSDPPLKDHAGFIIPPGETRVIAKDAHDRLASVLTDEQRRIHIDGTATSSDLVRIFAKQWDDKRHVLDEDYIIQPEDNLIAGYDPGIIHPTGMAMFAISPRWPKRHIAVKCWLHSGRDIDYDIECLDAWLLGRTMRALIYDYKANERQKHAQPLIASIRDKLREKGLMPYDNNVIAGDKRHAIGIDTMRFYLDPDPLNKNVEPLLVMNSSYESGCKQLRSQFIGYRGKESTKFSGPGGVVKKDDDLCFIGSTRIRMATGEQKYIKDIQVGEYVATPYGNRKVLRSWCKSQKEPVSSYITAHGRIITCTPNHPFFINSTEWCPIDSIGYADRLSVWTPEKNNQQSSLMTLSTTALDHLEDGPIKTEMENCYTELNGKVHLELSLKDSIFTIEMVTPLIMNCPTLNVYQYQNTQNDILIHSQEKRWKQQNYGISHQQGSNGTLILRKELSKIENMNFCVNIVERNVAYQGLFQDRPFAVINASQHGEEVRELTTLKEFAPGVDSLSFVISIPKLNAVVDYVVAKIVQSEQPVYDLEVDDAHCFYAEDLLCHNCDPTRYVLRFGAQYDPRYPCGAPTKEVSHPLIERPTLLTQNELERPMTNYERQMAMSKARSHKMVMDTIARSKWMAIR